MTRRSTMALVALIGLISADPLAGQQGETLARQGIDAYRELDYTRAATLLRQALDLTGRAALPPASRAAAWVYLGAAEFFQTRYDAAAQAFEEALEADPRHRPDSLVFPPAVTAAFESTRRDSRVVVIRAPPDTVITPGRDGWVAHLIASAPHELTVAIETGRRGSSRTLYEGAIDDSLEIRWNGTIDGDDGFAESDVTLVVSSAEADGGTRVLRMPLGVTVLRPDPLSARRYTDSLRTLGPAKHRPGATALAAGLATGIAAVMLPTVVSADHDGGPERFVIGGALGVAGVIGFLTGRQRDAERDALQREIDRIERENARRERDIRLRIVVAARVIESRAP